MCLWLCAYSHLQDSFYSHKRTRTLYTNRGIRRRNVRRSKKHNKDTPPTGPVVFMFEHVLTTLRLLALSRFFLFVQLYSHPLYDYRHGHVSRSMRTPTGPAEFLSNETRVYVNSTCKIHMQMERMDSQSSKAYIL